MTNLNNKFISFGKWVVKHKLSIVLVTMLLTVLATMGAQHLSFNNSYRAFFGKNNPQLKAFEKLQRVYTKDDNVLLAIKPQDNQVFSRETLETIEEFTEKAWQFPYSTRVDSITNYQHTEAEYDDLIVEPLIEDVMTMTDAQIAKAKTIATSETSLVNRLISPEADITGILVTLTFDDANSNAAIEATQYAEKFRDEIEKANPNLKVYLSGTAPLSNAFATSSMRDMGTLTPLMYLIIIVIMAILLRSFVATLSAVLVILFSAFAAMGVSGWLGMQITGPSSTAPTIILTLAIADSVHILITVLQNMRNGMPKVDAIVESIRVNMKPVFLTSLTTVIGFLSLNFSDAPPIGDLGNMTVIGVIFAFLLSVVFLPAFLALTPLKVKVRKTKSENQIMTKLSDFVINNRFAVLFWGTLISLSLVAGMSRIDLNDEFVKYFDKSTEFRNDVDYVVDNLTGIYLIEYSLDTGVPNGINDPEYLKKVEAFKNWFEAQDNVVQVSAFTDIMKRLNKTLHNDDESWYKIPDSRDLAAQYLLLYEMSLPYGLDLNNQINIDKSSTRFIVTLDETTTKRMRELADEGQHWLKNYATGLESEGTGASIMFSYISERNITSMMKGISIAIILITICLIISLRSLKFGLLSLLPNILPLCIALGIWGLTYEKIGFAVAIVASVNIGIIVDDTVHFLTKYVRARTEDGLSPREATRFAFSTVGIALLTTSVVLVLGFSVLAQSTFLVNNSMGILSVITISVALIADFLILPALLIIFEEYFDRGRN